MGNVAGVAQRIVFDAKQVLKVPVEHSFQRSAHKQGRQHAADDPKGHRA